MNIDLTSAESNRLFGEQENKCLLLELHYFQQRQECHYERSTVGCAKDKVTVCHS